MSEALLSATGLQKSFGAVIATHDLNLEVRRGEIHALIGPNGAGKTTTLAQLAGELQPDSGTIHFNGRDVTAMPVHARARLGLSRSYQVTSIFEGFSVVQNAMLAIQAHQGHSFRFWRDAYADPSLREPAIRVLKRMGLDERAELPASALAHGERRQLEVALALAGDPTVTLLDEPMAGMGAGGTPKMMELLRGLKGQTSVLLVEHDMDAVFALADRISVLVNGTCIATGTPGAIHANLDVRAAYLGEEEP